MSIKVNNFKKTHALNSWISLILSAFIVICVFVSLVAKLLSEPTELVEEVGLQSFRMFTVLSNMLVGVAVAMGIPFAVDGIRHKNYHLPRWIVNLIYISVNSISLTFFLSLFLLSPNAGFVSIMLSGVNLFFHTIVPISVICLFLFVNHYHTVKLRTTFLAMLPVLAYAIVYLISAIFIGEEDGGWRDHYQFETLMPWYFVLPCVIALSFGIAIFLRFVHNRMHRRDKMVTENFYKNAPEYDLPTIEEAIRALAKENRENDGGGDIILPRRVIKFFEKKYKSGKDLSYLCSIYVNEYLK